MKLKVFNIGEYLSYRLSKDDLLFIDKILNEWPGYCIWLNKGGKCYFDMYTLPSYLIKEIDKANSRLIVYPIKAQEVSNERTYDGTWTTFKYTVEKKTKSLKLGLCHQGLIKVGTSFVNTADVRKTDLTKQDKTLTRMNVWD